MTKTCLFSFIIYLGLLIGPMQANADLYKWVDSKGATHYGDKPPEDVKLKKISNSISSYTTVNVEPFVFDSSIITPEKSAAKSVIMYSTSWCGYCKKAIRHFKRNNIAYTDHDIEKSKKAAKQYRKLNGRGVPVILIGKRRMNGFSKKVFNSIYYGKS